jgi:hypothetical protein
MEEDSRRRVALPLLREISYLPYAFSRFLMGGDFEMTDLNAGRSLVWKFEIQLFEMGVPMRREKSNVSRHPLVELIGYRATLQSVSKESLLRGESQLLDKFPVLDRNRVQRLSSMKSPGDVLAKYCPNFSFSEYAISDLAAACEGRPPSDVYATVVCLSGFHWVYVPPPSPRESELVTLLDAITKIGRTQIREIVNFLVDSLFATATPESSAWSERAYQGALDHLRSNPTLDAGFANRALDIFRTIIQSGFPAVVTATLQLVDDLVFARSPILPLDKPGIISIIQPISASLHPMALLLLAHMTRYSTAAVFVDAFPVVAANMTQIIVETIAEPIIFEQAVTEIDPEVMAAPLPSDAAYEFIPQSEGTWDFDALPMDQVLNRLQLLSIVPKGPREHLQPISEALTAASDRAQLAYLRSFISICQSLSKESGWGLSIACFLIIFEDVRNCSLVEQLLPGFHKLEIWNPKVHIFHEKPLNTYLNSFRATLFDVIGESRTAMISWFRGLCEKAPYLYMESLVRVLASGLSLKMFTNTETIYELPTICE